MPRRFKRPRNDNFRHYCFECAHWTFIRDIGCAHEGVCRAIEDEPTEQDAYDKCAACSQTRLQGQSLRAVSITPIYKRLSDARLAFGGIDGDSYADGAGFYSTRAFSMPVYITE